jgi:arylsulfatase A-like enzyme
MPKTLLFFFIFLSACGLTRSLSDEESRLTVSQDLIEQKAAYLRQEAARRTDAPDIIWIVADDLGIADTDLYGSGAVHTPHLNRLADQGVRFEQAYVTASVCSPSRAAMLTGRYNQRFGFEYQLHHRYLKNKLEYHIFNLFMSSKPWYPQNQDVVPSEELVASMGLPASEITIAEVLKKYGYTTGLFGKWHLTMQNENGPNAFGFDEFYGFLNSHSLYADEKCNNIISTRNKKDWTDKYIWRDGRAGTSAIQRNGQTIEENRYLTSAITDEAIQFIGQSTQPYFAMLSYNAPHTPFQVPAEAYAKFATISDPVKRTYAAMISTLDDEIGKLLDYLVESNRLDHTLIFFISDNGGAAYTHATDNGGYKGGKITDFEGGLKVPMVMSWPAKIEQGKRFNHFVSSMDLFRTTLNAVTSDAPPAELDGADLIPAIQADEPTHDYLFFRKGYNHGVRSADYKMTWNSDTGDSLMYHIRTDPYEQVNIFNQAPEVEKNKLIRAYTQWEQGMVPARWPAVVNYRYEDKDKKVYWFEN